MILKDFFLQVSIKAQVVGIHLNCLAKVRDSNEYQQHMLL